MQKMIIQKKQQNTHHKTAQTVLTNGTLLGAIPGIVYIIMTATGLYAVFSNITWILLIIYGCGFLLAGILVTRRTKKISSAALAGLLAGAIGGSLVCGYLLVTFLFQPAWTFALANFLINSLNIPLNTPNNVPTTNMAIVLDSLVFVLAFLLTLALSTGLGFFGGIIGKLDAQMVRSRRFMSSIPKN